MVGSWPRSFLMVTWFRLNANLDTNWLEIVLLSALMANGILLFQCAMVRATNDRTLRKNSHSRLRASLCNKFKNVLVEYSSVIHVKHCMRNRTS